MELHDAFDRIADAAGLSQDERAVICGGSRALSGVVLALETIGAALELLPVPAAALCWLPRRDRRRAVRAVVRRWQ